MYFVDRAKQAMKTETDRPIALRQAIKACRKGGTVSVPGVYGGFDDKIPMGAFMNKGLAMKTGQTHMMRFMKPYWIAWKTETSIPVLLSVIEPPLIRRLKCTESSATKRTTAPRSFSIRGQMPKPLRSRIHRRVVEL